MFKKKRNILKTVVPIILIIVLIILLSIIVTIRIINNKHFSKLVISYRGEEINYHDINVENVIVVNNVSFWIVSVNKNSVVVSSSETLYQNDQEISEFKFSIGKINRVCFASDDCATFILY